MIQPLWRTVWKFLKKLKIELSYDPAIPLLGIYPEKTIIQKESCWGFPGGAVVKNPPANAGDMGSSPGPGRSHMPQSNLSLCATTTELRSRAREPQLLKPAYLEPLLCNKRSHRNEKPEHRNKE